MAGRINHRKTLGNGEEINIKCDKVAIADLLKRIVTMSQDAYVRKGNLKRYRFLRLTVSSMMVGLPDTEGVNLIVNCYNLFTDKSAVGI